MSFTSFTLAVALNRKRSVGSVSRLPFRQTRHQSVYGHPDSPSPCPLPPAPSKKRSHARFQIKTPTIGGYADHRIATLRLQNSTIEGDKKILRDHITPYFGAIRIDELTATRIATHSRELETAGARHLSLPRTPR